MAQYAKAYQAELYKPKDYFHFIIDVLRLSEARIQGGWGCFRACIYGASLIVL